MPGAINPLLQSPASPLLPGATPPPSPLGGRAPVPTVGPQPLGPQAAPPTPFEAASEGETGSRRKLDYRNVRHDHVAAQTLGWTAENALRTRDRIPAAVEKMAAMVRNPDLSRKDITSLIGDELKAGNMTADKAVTIINSIPQDNDEGELHDWTMMHLRALLGLQSHLLAGYPTALYPRGSGPDTRPRAPPTHQIAGGAEPPEEGPADAT
jgi:hypothetical protein